MKSLFVVLLAVISAASGNYFQFLYLFFPFIVIIIGDNLYICIKLRLRDNYILNFLFSEKHI